MKEAEANHSFGGEGSRWKRKDLVLTYFLLEKVLIYSFQVIVKHGALKV